MASEGEEGSVIPDAAARCYDDHLAFIAHHGDGAAKGGTTNPDAIR